MDGNLNALLKMTNGLSSYIQFGSENLKHHKKGNKETQFGKQESPVVRKKSLLTFCRNFVEDMFLSAGVTERYCYDM